MLRDFFHGPDAEAIAKPIGQAIGQAIANPITPKRAMTTERAA